MRIFQAVKYHFALKFALKDFNSYNANQFTHETLYIKTHFFHGGIKTMTRFRCLECKKEFEIENASSSRRCPECMSRYLELISGEIPRGKSWSAKSYSAR